MDKALGSNVTEVFGKIVNGKYINNYHYRSIRSCVATLLKLHFGMGVLL